MAAGRRAPSPSGRPWARRSGATVRWPWLPQPDVGDDQRERAERPQHLAVARMRRLRDEVDVPELEAAWRPQGAVFRRRQHERLVVGRAVSRSTRSTAGPAQVWIMSGWLSVKPISSSARSVSTRMFSSCTVAPSRWSRLMPSQRPGPSISTPSTWTVPVWPFRYRPRRSRSSGWVVRGGFGIVMRPPIENDVVAALDDQPAQASQAVARQPHDVVACGCSAADAGGGSWRGS